MRDKTISGNTIKSLQNGMHDAIVGGIIVRDIPSQMVFLSEESELTNFTDKPVGTIAAIYGFSKMWQLKPDKTWATIG